MNIKYCKTKSILLDRFEFYYFSSIIVFDEAYPSYKTRVYSCNDIQVLILHPFSVCIPFFFGIELLYIKKICRDFIECQC